jgi:hypothetical protein
MAKSGKVNQPPPPGPGMFCKISAQMIYHFKKFVYTNQSLLGV